MSKKSLPVWDPRQSASKNAARNLPELVARYFEAGRKLLQRSAPPNALHRFRLETKRLRYTLELFRPCYGPGLEQRLAALRKIQDLLGDINDGVTTLNLLGRAHKTLLQVLQRRMDGKKRQLHRYWRLAFDAAGRERWWKDYLRRSANRR